ncbi:MAG: ATP-grasp domain-containing protein [Calditrichaeota bacterium]|nr:MAG: ATP-grasp domain-containing protein [Calditrichota bacterium]MBL1204605.1 ATP-grasp domain-containing protein [Calditrichota bacterium]NOG44434.1 ATP-grasp domain-containing protein [Calditrichota bacterium]
MNVLIFGGGDLQVSLINKAVKLGYKTIVIDPDENAVGKELATHFYTIPGNDFESTVKICKKHCVNGIVTAATDKPLIMMARIAAEFGFKFPTVKSINNTIKKNILKDILQKNRIPSAKFVKWFKKDGVDFELLKYPLVLKPTDNSGSRGIIFVEDKQSLLKNIENTFSETKEDFILIEEYQYGEEISVEGIVYNKTFHLIQITDKTITPPPNTVELAHIQPSKYCYLSKKISSLLTTTTIRLGLDNCPIHAEIKVLNDELSIIEIGPRLGGDYITSHLVPMSTGVDIETEYLKLVMGSTPYFTPVLNKAAGIRYLEFPVGNVIDSFDFDKIKCNKNIVLFEYKIGVGMKIPKITNSLNRYGFYILESNNRTKLMNLINKMHNQINKKVVYRDRN